MGFKKLLIENGWTIKTESSDILHVIRPNGSPKLTTAVVELDKELFYNFSTSVDLKLNFGYKLEELRKIFKSY